MLRDLRLSLILLLIGLVIFGGLYPLATIFIGKTVFREQAEGSLVYDGQIVLGSRLIGQNFSSDKYFHGRPSAAGQGYDGANSSGSNQAVATSDFVKAVSDRLTILRQDMPMTTPVPVDLVTTSGSGLDPDISVSSARYQIPRISKARNLSVVDLEALVNSQITPRQYGFFGEPRVNVLSLNRALESSSASKAAAPP